MENLELDLKLTVAHVDAILKHLGKGVYEEVAHVIALLHGQAQPQIQAATVAAPPVPQYPTTDPVTTPETAPEAPAQ
jgi:hypothetical protein